MGSRRRDGLPLSRTRERFRVRAGATLDGVLRTRSSSNSPTLMIDSEHRECSILLHNRFLELEMPMRRVAFFVLAAASASWSNAVAAIEYCPSVLRAPGIQQRGIYYLTR